MSKQLNFLFVANYVKGHSFLKECRDQGIHTTLVSKVELRDDKWPEEIDELYFVRDLAEIEELTNAVSYLARSREYDAVVALDDYAVEIAAELREHLRCPGMGASTAHYFRDKLAMRLQAQEAGLNVPEFVHVLNHKRMAEYMERVPGPWLVKPRSEAGSVQIKKCHNPDEVWSWVEQLGDRASHFLMEAYVPGEVLHVDSIIYNDKVLMAAPHRYWRPPFDVWNGGGIFMSQSIPAFDEIHDDVIKANKAVIRAMGLPYGVTHVEFIRSKADGKLYFLELAARVGGAHIDRLVMAQTGVDLWQEWAKVEAAHVRGDKYKVKTRSKKHGGILFCLSKQREADLSSYATDELYWSTAEDYHAGLIFSSKNFDRVTDLMNESMERFESEIVAVAPPTAKPA